MQNFLQLQFKGKRRDYFANPQEFPFEINDLAIVETDNGEDIGIVRDIEIRKDPVSKEKTNQKKVLRKPSDADLIHHRSNRSAENNAFEVCRQKILSHSLAMKLVICEYQFDGKKITFYFTADKRVDFRELVKDLASQYKTRIELRQIGVRDEARKVGGYGVCGRELCCSSWIDQFEPVTTQAAKDQRLPLNPNKLAGACGRLKCCLIYERDFYNQAIKQFPSLAKPITTEKGKGFVKNIDIFRETLTVKYDGGGIETLPLASVKKGIYKCENNCGHEHGNMEDVR